MTAGSKALITVISIVAIGGAFFVLSKDKSSNIDTVNTADNTNTVLASYTSQDVSAHKTKSDCWTIINGSVYDITSYVQGHPGGDNILSACGVDATEYFNGDKKGQEGEANDHSNDSKAKNQLTKLKIGELTN